MQIPAKSSSPIWHPFTQHALLPKMTAVASAQNAYLYTIDGRRLIDGIASWWVITHGHCHARIVRAISEQAQRLDQVIFAGHTHEPAERLARKLVELTPKGLDYVFFSDSGSTSVEVALKMALGYWRHIGEARQRIVALEHGYHGDTIGTMSVGARGVFNAPYEPLLFEVDRVPFPHVGREQATLDALDAACGRSAVAAFIVEPLILGAGGMLMYAPRVLKEMKLICERHRVLFIADEVMTAWGRTGTLFASEQAKVVPDIACYAKGITGGTLPLAVTMCRAEIFDAHYSTDRRRTFFHSSSYTANPIACAAANANLELWEEEPVLERIARIGTYHERRLLGLREDARFANVRRTGTIAAVDIRVPDNGYLADIGPRLYEFFGERGVLLRPLGNTIYILPPYCVTTEDLDAIYDAIGDAVDVVGV
ncbi:MAG: adenosylmethionine--8-amino-7-oxononanoate transaminase [Candidatus Binataceae bacterium]|nr:adenosylmethionine--8-amino-7-oxononanoate transaminase [Candidatus Binataceae bacterium]